VTQHDQHFDAFQPHTLLKHRILDTYIVAWAMKILMWGRAGDRLAIVDGFAGAGQDDEGHPGSPIIVARRAAEAAAATRARKPSVNPRIQLFAIEENARNFRQLQQTLEPFRRNTPDLVHVLRGQLSDHIDGIVATLGDCPTFYFLDPYGIKGLEASTYPKMLAGPHNEVFALFADIGAVRLHGLVTAERADASGTIASILANPSLFPEEDARLISEAETAAFVTNEALDASIPASREHIARALGMDAWVDELGSVQPERRPDKFIELFRSALLRAGAHFVLSIPMRNDKGQRVYTLVHASKSRAAFITMKEAVSSGVRNGPLSEWVRNQMAEDLSVDLDALVQRLRRELAGLEIPWADESLGLKALLLGHTPLFHFQVDELKRTLWEAGLLSRVNRKEVCRFPQVGDTNNASA
jgi:three-Cys-motif partner protein